MHLDVRNKVLNEDYVSTVALRIFEAKSHELKTDLQGALQHYGVATMNVYYTLYKMHL